MSKQYDKPPSPAYWHETQHSMVRRNDNIDYHRGRTAYMLTLHIEGRKKLLATMLPLCAATRSFSAEAMKAVKPSGRIEHRAAAWSRAIETSNHRIIETSNHRKIRKQDI